MPARRGRGTVTARPPPTMPRSTARREMIVRFERAMSAAPSGLRLGRFDESERLAGNQADQELVGLVAAGGKVCRQLVEDRGVALARFPALPVPVHLADQAPTPHRPV